MKNSLLIKTILILAVVTSCRQTDRQKQSETTEQETRGLASPIEPVLADYKSDNYKISLGESYKISDAVIDWRWAALADNDDKIDSTGKDAFMYLGEPLINYNDEEYLPSLHIETDKDLITSFTCSILFNLEKNSNSIENFLNIISNDIKKLQIDSVKKSIITNEIFESNTEEYIETYKLTKGKELEYDEFVYTIKTREKKGRQSGW